MAAALAVVAGGAAGGIGIRLVGVSLLALAGSHVAVLLLGATAGAGGLLAVLGPMRVVLRYAERLVTHSATFRALADLRVWFFRTMALRSAGGLGMGRLATSPRGWWMMWRRWTGCICAFWCR